MTPDMFEKLTAEVVEIFPNEDPCIYYSPNKTVIRDGKKCSVKATGKLLEHYRYVRSELIEHEVLQPPSKKETLSQAAEKTSVTPSGLKNHTHILFLCFSYYIFSFSNDVCNVC